MTEHLPECPCNDKSAHPDGCLCCEVSSPCICDALSACEQRVLNAAVQRVEEMAIPHAFPISLTSAVWNQVIGECITAVKGDQQ